MDSFNIQPGRGLGGLFYLDMPINRVINKLQSFSSRVPEVRLITQTSSHSIILSVPDYRLTLIFHELYQTLDTIEIDCRPGRGHEIPILYMNQMLRDYSELPNLIESSYIPERIEGNSTLEHYKGITLITQENTLLKILIHKGNTIPNNGGRSTEVDLFLIYLGNKIEFKKAVGHVYKIEWNCFPEAIIEILGAPDKVYYKARNKTGCSDYFYNYFDLGVDLLFDGNSHTLKKIVMHTNQPENMLFNEYVRSHFSIFSSTGEGDSINPLTNYSKVQEFMQASGQIAPLEVSLRRYANGFKPTQYCSYRGVTFEVLQSGLLASVILTPD